MLFARYSLRVAISGWIKGVRNSSREPPVPDVMRQGSRGNDLGAWPLTMNLKPTERLCRSILRRSAVAMGYRVDGNHVFTKAAYERVVNGVFIASVSEAPHRHTPRVQRLARLLQETYA